MPRARIDREAIGRAALEIADDGGLEAITARTLAERLGVTPMALYRHVPSVSAVVDGLLERVVVAGRLLDHGTPGLGPWLLETFSRIRAALVAHPAVLPLAGTPAGYGAEALRTVDAVLGRLAAAGLPPEEAVQVFHALLAYTLGSASIEAAARRSRAASRERGGRASPSLAASIATLEGAPHVRAAAKVLGRFGHDATFRAGLARLVETMLGTSLADETAVASGGSRRSSAPRRTRRASGAGQRRT
jgi:AcrR family transcriptional regulator